MRRLAEGVTVQKTNEDGAIVTYTTPPDRAANEYLINRVMGKPVDRKVLTTPGGKSVKFIEVVRTEAKDAPAKDPKAKDS